MPKALTLEEGLAALHAIKGDPSPPAAQALLAQALNGKSNHLAAKAAQIAGEHEIAALVPALTAAFGRFMADPAKVDKGCTAKTAIVDALFRIGSDDQDLFLRGIRHVQMEPVYGGSADTAVALRVGSAMGLVRMNYPDVMAELADLLADKQAEARAGAARAIAYSADPAGVPLLRLRVRVGDEAEVMGECFAGMLKITPPTALAFVGRFLDHRDDAIAEAAALALGSSRLGEALPVLKACWEKTLNADRRPTALLAIALLRHDAALDFLLSIVATDSVHNAGDAIRALATYRHDPALRRRVEESVASRRDAKLHAIVAEAFGAAPDAPRV